MSGKSSISRRDAALVAAGAALGIFLTAALRRYARAPGKNVAPSLTQRKTQPTASSTAAGRAVPSISSEETKRLDLEQFSRIIPFFGEKGFQQLQDAFVIVVGLGGVGSHAAHMMARSGVGKLRLIDFDNVTLSSLNRHALATRSDVGLPKVRIMKDRLAEIVPSCKVEAVVRMFEESASAELLEGSPTYVLDCIDDVPTKVSLLEYCAKNSLKVITATGAGGKADPSRIHIGSLSDAIKDPLASKVRFFLKKKAVDPATVHCVYSSEPPVCELLPLDEEQTENPSDFGNVEFFRLRVIPVLGTMPCSVGVAMAAFTLTDIAEKPIQPQPIPGLARELRNKIYQRVQQRERDIFKNSEPMEFDKSDLDCIIELWRGRSPIGGARITGRERLVLTRWHNEQPGAPGNLILATTVESDKLFAEGNMWVSPEKRKLIEHRLALIAAKCE